MMFFNHQIVRAFLLWHSEVFTLRSRKRKREGRELFVTGSLYKFEKIGKGNVKLVKILSYPFSPKLSRYIKRSGFYTQKEWIDGFVEINKGKVPTEVFLYHARLSGDQ